MKYFSTLEEKFCNSEQPRNTFIFPVKIMLVLHKVRSVEGVSNGARKIWPLLDLLTKFK